MQAALKMVRYLTLRNLIDRDENVREESTRSITRRAAVNDEIVTKVVKSVGTVRTREKGKRSITEAGAGIVATRVRRADDTTVDIGVREITMMNTAILPITLLFSQDLKNAQTAKKARGLTLPVICQLMIISVHNRSTKTSLSLSTKVSTSHCPTSILRRKSSVKRLSESKKLHKSNLSMLRRSKKSNLFRLQASQRIPTNH